MNSNISLNENEYEANLHPFGGVLAWATWLVSTIIADNFSAIKYFEQNPDKLNLIF